MSSQYPNKLDTNIELPSVEENLTEIGGEAINGLRDAVFNIEETLGLNPQGSTSDVATRLNISLNSNGTIKSSALAVAGLLTSPIIDINVASNAGISESKLSLDYSTTQLKTFIDQGLVRINLLSSNLADIIGKVTKHVSHPSSWGRHQTMDIDGYYGKYSSYNLQGIIDNLDATLEGHISDSTDAHAASSISVDDSKFLYSADNAQEALNYLNNLGLITMVSHRDNDHDNGILSTQDVTLPNTKRSIAIVDNFPLYSISAGADFIRFTAPPVGFGQIVRDDVVVINFSDKQYEYRVSKTDSSTNVVYLIGVLTESGSASASVYRSSEEISSESVLKTIILQKDISSVGGSIIKVINPNSPFIMSSGTRPWELSDSVSQIALRWPYGETTTVGLNLKTQMETDIGVEKSEWTVENCVEVLNKMFVSYDMPILAFDHNGEMGIVYDGIDGYVEIVGPSGNSAWGSLGFVEGDKVYGLGTRKFYIDGYEYYDFRLISDSNGSTDGSLIIKSIDKNLVTEGVVASGIAKITPSDSKYYDSTISEQIGSVIYTSRTENTLTMSSSIFGGLGIQDVGIKIYADTFSLPIAPAKRTLYELFLDGYSSPYAEFRGVPRVEYYNCQDRRPNNPESWFDITAVSRNFGNSQKRIFYNGNYEVMFGDRGSNGTLLNYGNVVSLPKSNADGYKFRLYDNSNSNYIDLEIVSPLYNDLNVTSNSNAIDVDIYNRISEDRYLQVATVLHDKSKFSHLYDRRTFGTTGRKNISDDFKRDYIFYPTSLLRGNGVVMGLDVSEDITTSDPSINVNGGVVLVDGTITLVSKTNLSIPLDTANTTYNIFIDSNGILQILKDNTTSGLINPSLSEIINSSDKLMIAQVDYISSTQTINVIRDYRRFVGNIDGKIDLFVGHNEDGDGSFSSLRAAVNYLNALYPSNLGSKIIKVKGTNSFDLSGGPLYLPDGVSIVGDNSGNKNGDGYGAKIILTGTGTSFIVPGNNCALENVYIECAVGSTCSSIIGDSNNLFAAPVPTLVISGLKVIGCTFKNTTADVILFGKKIKDSIIKNNYVQLKATNYPDYIYGVLPSNLSGIFVLAEELQNVFVEENNCYCYGGGSILSFVYSYGTSTNVWISKNIIVAAGLLGYGIDAIGLKNATNVHVRENTLTFSSALYEGVLTSGVINLNGNVIDCSINKNTITYKNTVSQNDFWVQATENIISNFASFVPGFIISINSSYQLMTTYVSTFNRVVTNVEINENHIKAMCMASAICVGNGNGIGNNIRVLDNVIDDNSYLMLSGISVVSGRASGTVPYAQDINIQNNYVKNSIKIDYSDGFYAVIFGIFKIQSGLVSICGLAYPYNGYFIDVNVESNSLINDFVDEGLLKGIIAERVNNLFISENSIYNNHVEYSGLDSYSIMVNGANNCFVNSNVIADCGSAIYIKNITLGSLVFSANSNIINNSISSIYGNKEVVKAKGIIIQLKIENNIISNLSTKDALIYVDDCIGDRHINNNFLYSAGAYHVIQAIYLTGNGGVQKTFVNDNVIRIDGYLALGSIGCDEKGTIQDINILRNSIKGEHRHSGIYAIYSGTNNSSSMSNVFIEDNIIENTGSVELDVLGSLIKGGTTNIDAYCYNFNIKNNFVIGNGPAIWADGIYGLNINNNQLLGPVSHPDHSTIDLVYGVFCNRINYLNVDNNLVMNYHYPIYINNSIDISGVAGVVSICKNTVINSLANFVDSIMVNGLNITDVSIMDNVIHCSIVDTGLVSQYKLINCNGLVSCRTFICRNTLFSLKKLYYGIYVHPNSGDEVLNLVISDNKLLISGVKSFDGGCICVSTTGILAACDIMNNIISGTNLNSSGIKVLTDSIAELHISNNGIYSYETTYISNILDSMIQVYSVSPSYNINISNNILENLVSSVGVANGILCVGAGLTGLNIFGNTSRRIDYLDLNSCASINIFYTNGFDFVISGNIVSAASRGLCITGNITRGVISNNIIETTSESSLVVGINGLDNTIKDFIVTGNCFSNIAATTTADLVSIYSVYGQQFAFNNNILNSNHDGYSNNKMLLVAVGHSISVIGNHFSNSGGSSPVYKVAPVGIYSLDESDVCALNNLRDVFYYSGTFYLDFARESKIDCTGSNYNNFGENYTVTVPLSNFTRTCDKLTGIGSWGAFYSGGSSYSFSASEASHDATYYHLFGSFGNNVVPVGADIYRIDLNFSYVGTADKVKMGWQKTENMGTSLTTLSGPTSVVDGTNFMYYGSVPKMEQTTEHFIGVYTISSLTTYSANLYGARVSYTL